MLRATRIVFFFLFALSLPFSAYADATDLTLTDLAGRWVVGPAEDWNDQYLVLEKRTGGRLTGT